MNANVSPESRISELFPPALLCFSILQANSNKLEINSLLKQFLRYPNGSNFTYRLTEGDSRIFQSKKSLKNELQTYISLSIEELVENILMPNQEIFQINENMVSCTPQFIRDLELTLQLYHQTHTNEFLSPSEPHKLMQIYHEVTLTFKTVTNYNIVVNKFIRLDFDFEDPDPELVIALLFGKKRVPTMSLPVFLDSYLKETITIAGQTIDMASYIPDPISVIGQSNCLYVEDGNIYIKTPVIWRDLITGRISVTPFRPDTLYNYHKAIVNTIPRDTSEEVEQQTDFASFYSHKKELSITKYLDEFQSQQREMYFRFIDVYEYVMGELSVQGIIHVLDQETQEKILNQIRAFLASHAIYIDEGHPLQYSHPVDPDSFDYITEKASFADPLYGDWKNSQSSDISLMAINDENQMYRFSN